MSITALALAGALCASARVSYAQDAPPPERVEPSAQERLAALEASFQARVAEAVEALRRELEEERASGARRVRAMPMGPPKELVLEFLPKFQAEAAELAGRDEAIPFLLWIVRFAPLGDDAGLLEETFGTLTSAHLESAALRPVPAAIASASRVLGVEQADALLRKIEAGSPDANVQALAIFARVRATMSDASVTSAEYQAARKEVLRALELATDAGIDAELQGSIDGREKLIDGGIAPDIVGVDLDGVAFRLSDYRGKIVMLDFWGDW